MNEIETRAGASWAVQGCLFGAVGLFVILLLVMVFLAYRRFQENTQPTPGAPVSWVDSRTLTTIG